MKRYIIIAFLLLLANTPAFASGSLHAGHSKGANLIVYHSKNWSTEGFWNLSDYKLPDGAVVSRIEVKWDCFSSFSNQSYDGLKLYLFNQQGKRVLLNNDLANNYASTDKFNRENPKQKWKLKYKVNDFKYEGSYFAIIPQLIIYYEIENAKED